jgi:hypothetical protein
MIENGSVLIVCIMINLSHEIHEHSTEGVL